MSKLIYLSKSDFKIAKSCPTKLYYKKLEYPQNQQVDYNLSIGGLITAKIAELLYDNTLEIEQDYRNEDTLISSIELTNQALKQENITIIKPLIYHEHKLSRLDILAKNGNKIDLIYIKPKAIAADNNSVRNKRDGKISSIWKSYLQDITYQAYILSELLDNLGEYELNSYLCLPIKNKVSESCLGKNFSVSSNYKVEFLGNINELRNDHILQFINVNLEVLELTERVITKTQIYLESIVNGIKKIKVPINKNCKGCEFRIINPQLSADLRNGFNECWSQLQDHKAHILDLYQVAKIGEYRQPIIDTLIEAGKSSLYDIPTDTLNHDSFKDRQLIQIKHTKINQEWFSKDLEAVLNCFEYPLHFIDFETCRLDIPYDRQTKPYEQLAFQWSCHTITEPNTECVNTNFIDITGDFPNFKFAEALRRQLGNSGTVLIWGTHEKSVLADICAQISSYHSPKQDLLRWLANLISDPNQIGSRLIDMNNLTLKYYFHPLMKGKTSLKSVLPAIWSTNSYLHQVSWLSQYFKLDRNGQIISPYQTLSAIEIGDRYQVIKEGSGAMIAYQEILYSPDRNDLEIRQKWETLLKQYCCLDTLAMVIVWTHWQYLINKSPKSI